MPALKLTPVTKAFLLGVVAGMANMSVMTYILVDNTKQQYKAPIATNILPQQMR
jgi:hypothetical protein